MGLLMTCKGRMRETKGSLLMYEIFLILLNVDILKLECLSLFQGENRVSNLLVLIPRFIAT